MRYRTQFYLTLIVFIIFGCKTTQVESPSNLEIDNKYDSEFPDNSVSRELKSISESVMKLDVIAFYATYFFPKAAGISKADISDSLCDVYERSMEISHESVNGTASVIYKSSNIIGMLTCAHVIDFPDTLFTYSDSESDVINTMSVLIKHQIHISGLTKGEPIELVAKDDKHDIAILSKKTEEDDYNLKVLSYPIGNVKDLQWGSVVYIMGYPLNNLMVTRAIVSINEKIKTGFFTTDALYNHGISGSPVFAMRDGSQNFEIVGMASSSSAQSNRYLTPDKDRYKDINPRVPYEGKVFVDNNKLINYGVTFSVTIDEITNFIQSNNSLLTEKGFFTDNFFK